MDDQATGLLTALEDERRYVARELHDGIAQTTLQLGLQIGICRKLLERGNLERLTQELVNLEERIQATSRQVREMISDLRPPLVEPEASLADYIDHEIENHHQRGGTPVIRRLEGIERLSTLSEAQVMGLARVVQEALLNVRKHAQAEQVYVGFRAEAEGFSLTIADNGKGFNPVEVASRPTDKGGAGLANLRARVEAIGGLLSLTAGSKGTKVTVKLPQS